MVSKRTTHVISCKDGTSSTFEADFGISDHSDEISPRIRVPESTNRALEPQDIYETACAQTQNETLSL